MNNIETYNDIIMTRLSQYLNNNPSYITKDMVAEITEYGINEEEAIRILLSSILGLYEDKNIMDLYFKYMIKKLDIKKYINNPYYKNIRLDNIFSEKWEVKTLLYKPYEIFVYNDLKVLDDGRVIPKLGFFNEEYKYPCIMQDSREWMLITPNEIETMDKPIKEAFGNVLTYGLGLGYFAYMTSLSKKVESVTIVECDKEVIEIFNKYILPQFEYKDKIKVIQSDAYEYASRQEKYDYVFVDIWHDPSDGVDAYKKFKSLEIDGVKYSYWIEDTLKYYIDE